MKWIVMGAGGVGGYFGGRLAEAGEEVWFVARGEHLAALRDGGLRVESVAGDFAVEPCRAVEDPAEAGEADAVLVAVKSWQTEAAARALGPAVGPRTTVVSLQNGATAAEEIGAVVGMDHMLGGTCRLVAFLAGPGRVTHAAVDPTVAVGELDSSRSERAEGIFAAFQRCQGVDPTLSGDIQRDIWTKFAFIASVSGIGAVTRVSADRSRSVPETRALLVSALQEVEAVARARGVALGADIVDATLRFIDSLPDGATASMQRDIVAGLPSELEAQNGAVVRLGRDLGVPTPTHDFLYAALKPQEILAREDRS